MSDKSAPYGRCSNCGQPLDANYMCPNAREVLGLILNVAVSEAAERKRRTARQATARRLQERRRKRWSRYGF